MISSLKKSVHYSLKLIGYELKPKNRMDNGYNKSSSPPIIVDDMLEALHLCRGGTPASFYCPLENYIHRTGLSFSQYGWHPYVETLKEYREYTKLRYENSTLKKYYDKWQPTSAAQAFAGFKNAPVQLRDLPPHLIYLVPWSSGSVERIDKLVRKWHNEDNIEHGKTTLDIDNHGFSDFGPVSDKKGNLEFMRLINIYNSIKEKGYDRKYGDVNALVLKRGSEYKYLNKGDGYHRTVAMVALGHDKIPTKFYNPWIISIDDIGYWPQVRNGLWSREEAAEYFNYLFDFDSRTWAQNLGLLRDQQKSNSNSL